ncbi:MAG: TonB-dependent receptor [Pseudomonadota bacterium]
MRKTSLITIASLFISTQANAQDDLETLFGGAVELATGYEKSERLAPAVVNTITREQIEALGAITVDEVLDRVAGVVVEKNRVGDPIFVFRGIYNELNPQVLVMVDGIPIGEPVNGGRSIAWRPLVFNIEKIEIVRGPGSAIFGADAFAGVINVITKTRAKTNANEIGAFGGTFGTFGGHAIATRNIGGWKFSGSLEGYRTNGNADIIPSDAQSVFDALAGVSSSFAPGPINETESSIAGRLNVDTGGAVSADFWLQSFFNNGQTFGSIFVLDPIGERNVITGGAALRYKKSINDYLVEGKLSTTVNDVGLTQLFAPQGAATPAPPFLFPFNAINRFGYTTSDTRGDLAALKQFKRHTIRAGAGFAHQRAFNVNEQRNFALTPFGFVPATDGSLLRVEGLGQTPTAGGNTRTIGYVSLQDEWQVNEALTLTVGARFDQYFDDGGNEGTVNPRASLVWAPNLSTTVKLLYGSAFRAPTFIEAFANAEGIVAVGNPDLDPEMIDTIEISINHQFSDRFEGKVAAYRITTENEIVVVDPPDLPPTFANVDGREGYGVEIEGIARPTNWLQIDANYAFQTAEHESDGSRVANVPRHIAFVDVGLKPTQQVDANVIVRYVGDRARTPFDPRPALDGYVRTDFTIAYTTRRWSNVKFMFVARNLFDNDLFSPTADGVFAPGDFPLEGRVFRGGINLNF